MVKIEQSEEPLDKQQTEAMPVVKPTMNTLILERMDDMEESFSSGLHLTQHLAIIHKDNATIKMQNWTNMILNVLILISVAGVIVMLSLVFGRMLP